MALVDELQQRKNEPPKEGEYIGFPTIQSPRFLGVVQLATANAVNMKTQAGIPTGGMPGDIVIDTTDRGAGDRGRIYVKIGSTWRYTPLT